ncbi:MAG: ATP-binding cassette domain-containing protein [Syntrophobacteraceae bacterium]
MTPSHPNIPPREGHPSGYLVQCLHVYKQYGREGEVFRDATLLVRHEDFLFVTGPSGSGKSTLLKMIFGMEPFDRGTILIGGRKLQDITRKEIPFFRRRIGLVFQDSRLLLHRSVFENVAIPLEAAGKEHFFIRKKVYQLLRFVGMEQKMGVPCLHLSEAERQKVAIARAVANDPVLMLADEPTGNLDTDAAQSVLELLGSVQARGVTVILATHDPALQEAVPGARAVRIAGGRIAEDILWPLAAELVNGNSA